MIYLLKINKDINSFRPSWASRTKREFQGKLHSVEKRRLKIPTLLEMRWVRADTGRSSPSYIATNQIYTPWPCSRSRCPCWACWRRELPASSPSGISSSLSAIHYHNHHETRFEFCTTAENINKTIFKNTLTTDQKTNTRMCKKGWINVSSISNQSSNLLKKYASRSTSDLLQNICEICLGNIGHHKNTLLLNRASLLADEWKK